MFTAIKSPLYVTNCWCWPFKTHQFSEACIGHFCTVQDQLLLLSWSQIENPNSIKEAVPSDLSKQFLSNIYSTLYKKPKTSKNSKSWKCMTRINVQLIASLKFVQWLTVYWISKVNSREHYGNKKLRHFIWNQLIPKNNTVFPPCLHLSKKR